MGVTPASPPTVPPKPSTLIYILTQSGGDFTEQINIAGVETVYDPVETAKKYGKAEADLVGFFLKLFLQDDVPAETRQRLVEYSKKSPVAGLPVYWTEDDAARHRVRTLAHLVLTQP